jgi:serine phosphatase RsbU (regulator of sigma subunit)
MVSTASGPGAPGHPDDGSGADRLDPGTGRSGPTGTPEPVGLADPARLEALAATGLSATADPSFERFTTLVRRLLDVPVSLVSLVDEKRQFFPGEAGLGSPWAEERETPLSHSFCQHVVLRNEPLVISDATEVSLVCDNLAIPDLGVVAYAGMPLTDEDGRVLGSLCAIDTGARDWPADQLSTLADLAAACSAELRLRIEAHRARAAHEQARTAQAEVERTNDRLSLLASVSRALSSTLKPDEVLDRLTRLLVPALADWCLVSLVDEAGVVTCTVGEHGDDSCRDALEEFVRLRPRVLDHDSSVWHVLRSGKPLLLPHAGPSVMAGGPTGPELERVADRLGVASVLVVPLRSRRRSIGSLMLVAAQGRAAYDEDTLSTATDLAARAGLAIDNARLYHEQRRTAEVLQRSMLTELPTSADLELAARYQPAADEVQVGGDWYDAFRLPDGGTCVVIGDVVGHDLHAAAAMGQVRQLVRAIAYDRGESPALVLQRVDRALGGLDVSTFATVLVARVDRPDVGGTGLRLRWANAGHPPPLVLTPGEGVVTLERPADLLLGYSPDTTRVDHEDELPAGATLLLYTDGLVERRDSPLDHGLARLRQSARGLASLSADEVCSEVLARMVPADAEDDVAVLAVRPRQPVTPRADGPG